MSIYRGIVTDIADPEGLMRVKVKVPQIFGQVETDWVWPSIPIALGVQAPIVGDPIWIMFEADDKSRPVWVGVWRTSKAGGLTPDMTYGGVVGETTYGLAPNNGAAQTASRSDHTHGSPSLTSSAPTTIQPDAAAVVGTGATPSRSDHQHAVVTDVAGAILADDTAAEGASTAFSRADHRHAIVTLAPGSSAPSDVAAEGTSPAFSRADHVHGREAPAAAADQTMQWMICAP